MEYLNTKHEIVANMKLKEYDITKMNKKYLKLICEGSGLYSTPSLNSSINLGNKGFKKIEELEEYYNLSTIYLHSNGIMKIENLGFLINLKCLFLQNNMIQKIEGLEKLIYLDTLDLTNNEIRVIENLEKNISLTKLNISKNKLTTYNDIKKIEEITTLINIDFRSNFIEYDENIIPLFQRLESIRTIYLSDNPIKPKISNYRKTLVATINSLTFLDDRPISNDEKRLAKAWLKGGREGEDLERLKLRDEKLNKHKSYIKEIDNNREQAKIRAMKNLQKRVNNINIKKEEIRNDIIEVENNIKNSQDKENLEIIKKSKIQLENKIQEYNEYIEEIDKFKDKYEDENYDLTVKPRIEKNEENKEFKQDLYEKTYLPDYKDIKKEENTKKAFEWNTDENNFLEILLEDNLFDFEKISIILKNKYQDYNYEDFFEIQNLKKHWNQIEEVKYNTNPYELLD